jgi:hypothetical protein
MFFSEERSQNPNRIQKANFIPSESGIDQGLPALHRFIELLPFFAEKRLAATVFRVYIFLTLLVSKAKLPAAPDSFPHLRSHRS